MQDRNMHSYRNSKFIVLYGSQTGTAEEVAERVVRGALRNGYDPYISCMDLFEFNQLPYSQLLVIIVSTTGQGEEPDNMKLFWKSLLKRHLSPGYLTDVSFTVLGLGDSSYVKYNFVAKKVFKRLKQLGAKELIPLFLADDQHELGPDTVIDEWLEAFWAQTPISNTKAMKPGGYLLPPKFQVLPIREDEGSRDGVGWLKHVDTPSVWKCKLTKNKRVTADDHFQDVRLLSIDLGDSGLKYDPGDVLVVQPINFDDNVEEFFRLFPQLDRKRGEKFTLNRTWIWVKISSEMTQLHPFPWTWEQVVRNYFDIQAIPKRYFFELLSYFTDSDLEREKLLEFCSTSGQQDLYSYCNRPKRNILEVLADFPHALANIPINYLFDLIPAIKPRSFSIASSMAALGNELQILVAVVNFQTKLKKRRLGLCSNWLANLIPGDEVPVWIQPGSFHFPPPDSKQAVIMVGPGTGCAPFRSFISERAANSAATLTLFFGCRFSNKDFYFEDEWTELHKKKQLNLFTAFSRENPDGRTTYVQHKILEAGKLLTDLIQNHGAAIYVAGNAKRMPIDVAEAFVSILDANDFEKPAAYLKKLMGDNRYQTEVWS